MGNQEYEVSCENCLEEISVTGHYLSLDGNSNPNERPTRICGKCTWKDQFDISLLDRKTIDGVTSLESTYDGREIEEWQAEYIEEIVHFNPPITKVKAEISTYTLSTSYVSVRNTVDSLKNLIKKNRYYDLLGYLFREIKAKHELKRLI